MIVLAPLAARAAGTGGVGGGGGGLGGGSTRGISWQDCSLYMCPAGGVARRAAAVISEVQQQDGDRYTYSSTCNMHLQGDGTHGLGRHGGTGWPSSGYSSP